MPRIMSLFAVVAVLSVAACDGSTTTEPMPPKSASSPPTVTASPSVAACPDPELSLAAKPIVGAAIVESVSVIDSTDGTRNQTDVDQELAGPEPTIVWDAPGLDVGVQEINGSSGLGTVGEQLSDWGVVEAAVDLSPAGDGLAVGDADVGLVVAFRRVRPMTAQVKATCGGKTWTGSWATYTEELTTLDDCDSNALPPSAKEACSSVSDSQEG